MEKFEIVKNEDAFEYWFDVTDIVRNMIGNLVESAKIRMFYYFEDEDVDKNSLIEFASVTLQKIESNANSKNSFDFDAFPLNISFSNGRTIRIKGSEWTSLRIISD